MSHVELRDTGRQAPDFLTVAQTARALQTGRSTADDLVSHYLTTNGAEGIPAVRVGGQLRQLMLAVQIHVRRVDPPGTSHR